MRTKCRGKRIDGAKCPCPCIQGDNRCLAHKLKMLPREVVTLIFDKIEDLTLLKTYASIYAEALPSYHAKRLEHSKCIASDLISEYNLKILLPNSEMIAEVSRRIESGNQEQIDTSIFLTMFALPGGPHFSKAFANAVQYLLSQFSSRYKNVEHLMSNGLCRLSMFRGYVIDEWKCQIQSWLIGARDVLKTKDQMSGLVFFLITAYITRFRFGKFAITRAIANSIAHSVEEKGVSFFSKRALEKIFTPLYSNFYL